MKVILLALCLGCTPAMIINQGTGGSSGTGGKGTGGQGTGGNVGSGGLDGSGGITGIGGVVLDGIGGLIGSGGVLGIGGIIGVGGMEDIDASLPPTYPIESGQLVITEIMQDTAAAVSDNVGEWFEIWNSTNEIFDIRGCSIFDTSNRETITRSILIMPGKYITLGRFANKSDGGFIPDYMYSVIKFSDAGDKVGITCNFIDIDKVDFTIGFPLIQGKSLSLDPNKMDLNDIASSWCNGKDIYNTVGSKSDYGSPGILNPVCM